MLRKALGKLINMNKFCEHYNFMNDIKKKNINKFEIKYFKIIFSILRPTNFSCSISFLSILHHELRPQ